jgi:hypothetical protein
MQMAHFSLRTEQTMGHSLPKAIELSDKSSNHGTYVIKINQKFTPPQIFAHNHFPCAPGGLGMSPDHATVIPGMARK